MRRLRREHVHARHQLQQVRGEPILLRHRVVKRTHTHIFETHILFAYSDTSRNLSLSRSLSRERARSLSRSQTHALTHALTHARTHAHTHVGEMEMLYHIRTHGHIEEV